MSAEEVFKALQGLQHDALHRKEFNDWLQNFQRSDAAWQVTGEVLKSTTAPRELKIFCAQTLRNKSAYDMHQVPTDHRLALKDEVIGLMETNRDLLNVVGVQLGLALASFALQVVEWSDPVGEMIAKLDTEEKVPLLFEFLRVLPEQFHSTGSGLLNHEIVIERSTQLIENQAYRVMEYVLSRAELMSSSSDLQALFFGTLTQWLTEVQLADIMASPLVPWMFASLANDDARAAAVDCLVIVLQETTDIYEPPVQSAIQQMYPEIIRVIQTNMHEFETDAELHRECTRLVGEAASAWHVLVVKQTESFLPLVEAVAACVLVPDAELTTVELTFEFFSKFRALAGEPMPDQDGNYPSSYQPMISDATRKSFYPVFIRLAAQFVKFIALPQRFSDQTEEDVFRDFRYDLGDMLKVCSSVLGHEGMLKWFHEQILALSSSESSTSGVTDRSVEALLFGCRSIARTIPATENTYMPQVFDAIFRLPFMNSERVQHALIMLLGRYSQWAKLHGPYLQASLEHIMQSSWSEYLQVRRAAAHSFVYLCTDAAYELSGYIMEILKFYVSLTGKTDLSSLLNYSDGIGSVIGLLNDEEIRQAIQVVFAPVTERVQVLLKDPSLAENKVDTSGFPQLTTTGQGDDADTKDLREMNFATQVAYDLQGLGNIVAQISILETENAVNCEHPLYVAVMAQNEPFTRLLRELGPKNPVIIDNVARYYTRVLFNLAGSFQPDLPLLLAATLEVQAQRSGLPVLYQLGSTICRCYSAYAPESAQVDEAIWNFLHQTSLFLFQPEISVCIEKESADTTPEESVTSRLVFEGIELLCDVATNFPQEYLTTLFENSIVLTSHVLRHCSDLEALEAVSHLYDDVQKLLPSDRTPFTESIAKADRIELRGLMVGGLERSGMHLLGSLFYWFMIKPDDYFEAYAERIVDFVFSMVPQPALEWLNKILADLPADTTSPEEVTQFLSQMFVNATRPGARGAGQDLNRYIRAYAARNYDPRF